MNYKKSFEKAIFENKIANNKKHEKLLSMLRVRDYSRKMVDNFAENLSFKRIILCTFCMDLLYLFLFVFWLNPYPAENSVDPDQLASDESEASEAI